MKNDVPPEFKPLLSYTDYSYIDTAVVPKKNLLRLFTETYIQHNFARNRTRATQVTIVHN